MTPVIDIRTFDKALRASKAARLWQIHKTDLATGDCARCGRTAADIEDNRIMTCQANTSGVRPLDQRVIVKLDSTERTTAGGIIIPESAAEKEDWAQMKGTLIAAGANAWAESRRAGEELPGPGDRVLVAKYGGKAFKGADGEEYKIMNDEDVTGVLEEA